MLLPVRGTLPEISQDCYLAPTAQIIGDVVLGESSSVWFNAVLRGDVMPIRIGKECNLQDNVVVHGTYQSVGTVLGDRVSVGHSSILHGTYVGSGTLIGMGVILMDHSRIGRNCLVAAGSLVTEGTVIPDGQLVMGSPAKVKRPLTEEEIVRVERSADNYLLYKNWYTDEGETEC